MVSGRLTDYSKDVEEKAKDYLVNWKELGDAIPSIAGLAIYLEKSRSTIYEWGKDPNKSIFSDILELILANQERTTLNGGITGDLNPQICKLVLGKHGYVDKSENKNDITSNGNTISSILNEIDGRTASLPET